MLTKVPELQQSGQGWGIVVDPLVRKLGMVCVVASNMPLDTFKILTKVPELQQSGQGWGIVVDPLVRKWGWFVELQVTCTDSLGKGNEYVVKFKIEKNGRTVTGTNY